MGITVIPAQTSVTDQTYIGPGSDTLKVDEVDPDEYSAILKQLKMTNFFLSLMVEVSPSNDLIN